MRRWGEAGVTLPEVLVAMLLIGIALVPLLQLYPSIIDAGRASEVNTILSAAAVRKMEENISILRRPSGGGGAVTFDNSVTRGSSGSELSTSASMTIGASATYVVIFVGFWDGTSTVSSVSVGGSAASRLVALTHSGVASRAELWGLASPPTGSVTITVTLSSAEVHAWVAASFSNVSTSTPIGNTGNNIGDSAAPSVSVGTRTASSMLVAGFEKQAIVSATQGGGQTAVNTVTSSFILTSHLARETSPGGAGVDMNWTTGTDTSAWVTLAVELGGGSTGVANPNGSATCTDVPNCLLVWTTTDELSSATPGVGALKTVQVVACQDTNASTSCDAGEPQVRYDTKVTTRP